MKTWQVLLITLIVGGVVAAASLLTPSFGLIVGAAAGAMALVLAVSELIR